MPSSTTSVSGSHAPDGPTQLPGAGWDYGTELAYLQELCDVLGSTSSTGARRRRGSTGGRTFLTEIDGEQVHFIHARSPEPDALPLVVTHGWPGSVVEFLDIIGPLTDPPAHGGDAADAFHVVCPSMPGYGWSGPDARTGLGHRARRRGVDGADGARSVTSATARRAATGARS